MNRYIRVDRGSGSRAGQLLRHYEDPHRWQVRVFLGRDSRGKKLNVSEVVHGTKREAQARLTELLQTRNQGKLRPRSKITLADLVSEWLKHKEGSGVSARTLASYRNALNTYVLPVLGHRRVADLTLREVERLYADMRAGALPTEAKDAGWRGDPLGARSVQITHTALHQVLKQAVRHGLTALNPIDEASVPSAKSVEKRTLTVAEREAFLTAAIEQGAFYRVLYQALMDTGMRPGEACALTWTDVDFVGEQLTITKAITRGKDGQRISAAPKTAKSRRTIPMFGLRDVLLEHRRWQAEVGLGGTGHVFTNQEGGILAPWAMNKRELDRVTTAAGITGFTLYGFRHTFATLHLQSGTPLKIVSEWLGHATIQQTANTYQHLITEVSMNYAERHVQWLRQEAKAARQAVVN